MNAGGGLGPYYALSLKALHAMRPGRIVDEEEPSHGTYHIFNFLDVTRRTGELESGVRSAEQPYEDTRIRNAPPDRT